MRVGRLVLIVELDHPPSVQALQKRDAQLALAPFSPIKCHGGAKISSDQQRSCDLWATADQSILT